jgi:6-phosphogluconolactonase (cycloisomerase 2 family)
MENRFAILHEGNALTEVGTRRVTTGTVRKLAGVAAAAFAVCIMLTAGCGGGKFFVPVCQAYNTCSSGGGGGGGGSSTNASYVYVANYNPGTIAGFPIPKTSFTGLNGSTYTLGTPPSVIAANPKGTLLFVATAAGGVFVYVINPANGALALGNSGQPVTSTLNPTWMTVDPSGNWLFMVSNSSNQLLVFQINPSNGVLTQTNQGTIALSTGNPTQVYITPNDTHVLVGLGIGGTDTFLFDPTTGVLSDHLHIRTLINGGSSDNTFGADNKSAYAFIGEAGSGIRVFSIASTGAMNEIAGSPFQTQLGPSSIVVNSTNAYVYVANRTVNLITGYSLASSGALTQLSTSPFQTGSAPTQMALDPTGKYIFVICAGGNPDLQAFSFDTAKPGKLDSVTSTATGSDPVAAISLAVVP